MTPLPPALGGVGDLVIWRLDRERHASSWSTGEGAYRGGGRWNSKGVRAIYCSLDPATAILEVAVHKAFDVLDVEPHISSQIAVNDVAGARIVQADEIPNPNWLRPGTPSKGQQAFGDGLIAEHPIVLLPSVVSTHSWNVILRPDAAVRCEVSQERFALDTRLASKP
jgi:RES domain-containing protein